MTSKENSNDIRLLYNSKSIIIIPRLDTIMTFNGHYPSNVSKEFILFIFKLASKQIKKLWGISKIIWWTP